MKMARIFACVLSLVFVVTVAGHKYHPKFRKSVEDFIVPAKVACTSENVQSREALIEKSKCGEPKEVFEYLKTNAAHEQVRPRAVWVKRCVGLCEYDNEGSCVPIETVIRHIPIRIYNAKTNKETCATYPITEHLSCGCCAQPAENCPPPKVFNPQESEMESS